MVTVPAPHQVELVLEPTGEKTSVHLQLKAKGIYAPTNRFAALAIEKEVEGPHLRRWPRRRAPSMQAGVRTPPGVLIVSLLFLV